ncbi:MAG: hypothetical protein QG639_567 [Patescibacteria group bacterium]|nr:hypothetical protein [Patescibacteria group bacterium]
MLRANMPNIEHRKYRSIKSERDLQREAAREAIMEILATVHQLDFYGDVRYDLDQRELEELRQDFPDVLNRVLFLRSIGYLRRYRVR